ncbi:MAG: hypothetical protein FJY98_01845 [Candidatus Liptonbacteria bacterium]|nr:hypothetical protein [Candidatus Liptonbacteria bacterium]
MRRVEKDLLVPLGFQQARWLAENQNDFWELKTLDFMGRGFLDFPGLVVVCRGCTFEYVLLDPFNMKFWTLNWAGYSRFKNRQQSVRLAFDATR